MKVYGSHPFSFKYDNEEFVKLPLWLRDINTRLNQLVYDPIFTNRLTLVQFVRNPMIESPVSSAGRFLVYPLTDPILERFCFQILPEISEKIQCLCLESISMERVLRATNYSNLSELSLLNIEAEKTIEFISGKIQFISILL